MAQYPVPQFIEEEGKIIFFLSYRQFFLLVGGLGSSIMLYLVLGTTHFVIFLLLSIFIVGLTLTVAFLKIDNVPVIKHVLNFMGFATGTKNYVWRKKELMYSPELQKKQKINFKI